MPKFIFPDGSSVQIPEGVDPGVATRNIIKQFAGKHGLPEDAGEKSGLMGDIKAAGISGLSTTFDLLPGFVRAVAGGDWNNPQLQKYRYITQTVAPSLERASTQKLREEADKAIESREKEAGILSGLTEAVKQYGGSRLGPLSAAQSVPPLLLTGIVGKAAATAATRALPYLAARFGAGNIAAAGAIGTESTIEGADAAASTYQAVFDEAIKKGIKPEEADKIAANAAKRSAAASAGTTAVLGALPIPSAEKLLARRLTGNIPGGRFTTAGLGAAGEVPTGMIQGAVGSIGVQRGLQDLIPEEQRTTEQLLQGVGGAMGQSVVGAGLVGGGAGFLSGGRRQETPPPAPAAEAPPEQAPPVVPGQPPAPVAAGPSVPPPPVMTPEERQVQRNTYKEQIAQLMASGLPPETIAEIKAEIGGKLNNKTPSIANLTSVGEILKKYQPEGETNVPGNPATVDTGTGVGVSVAGVPEGNPPPGEVESPATGALGGTNVPPSGTEAGEGTVQPPLDVVGFKTEKGSTYVLTPDGKTSRTKRSPGEGQGTTYEPHTVMYVDPGDHTSIMSDMQGGMGNASVRLGYVDEASVFKPVQNNSEIPAGSQPVVGVFNKKTNDLIGMYEAQTAPQIGMHPVEKLYNSDGTASTHVGNKIVELENKQAAIPKTVENQTQFARKENLDPEDAEAAKVQNGIKGKDIVSVANWLTENHPNEEGKLVAEAVSKQLKNLQASGIKFNFAVKSIGDSIPSGTSESRGATYANYTDATYDVHVKGADVTGYVGTSYEIVLHELVHAATMGAIKFGNLRAAQNTQLSKDTADLYNVSRAVIAHFNNRVKNNKSDLTEFEKRIFSNKVNALLNPDEILTWAFTNKDMQDYLETIPYKGSNLWSEFVNAVRKILNLPAKADTALSEILRVGENILSTDTKSLKDISAKAGINYAISKGPAESNAPKPKKPRSPAQLANDQRLKAAAAARRAAKEAEAQQKAANLISPSKKWIDDIRRKFQNVQIGLYNLSDAVKEKLGGILPAELDLASALSLSKGEAAANFENYAGKLERRYTATIQSFMKATKTKAGEAMRQLSNYLLAKHELERRVAIYYEHRATLTDENEASRNFLKSAIVANDKELTKIKKDFKAEIKTAEQQRIYDVVENSQDRAKDLYQEIVNLVNGDPKAQGLDFNATTYDVVSYENDNGEEVKMTPQERDKIIADMEAKFSDPKVKAAVEEAIEVQQALDKAIQEMNKKGDYVPKGAARLMEARGWKNYVPQRGKQKEESEFEYYGESGGAGLTQSESALGGRNSLADNVITRSIAEAKKAAGRAPGNRVTEIIRNYVDQGYIKGKISKTPLTTLDNYILGKNVNKGDDIVLYRDPEGDIYEVKIDDKNIAAAIQAKTHDLIPIAEPLATATTLMAQTNTRFNPMFWLKNFFVDPLTNTFIIASEQGFTAGKQYASRVVSDLWDSKGTAKSVNFMRLYAKGELEQIGELAAKDAWYRDALEFVNIGGRVSYLSGLRNETQMDEMYKNLGPGKVIRTVEQLAAFVDPITEGLELALRVSAFRTAKTFPEFEGDVRKAAAYSKDLANFEQIGQWGKWMGAWFMFSRPSATGASRLYDALSKGKYAKQTVLTSAAFGASVFFLSMLMSGDDDEGRNRAEHDDPARWVRNWRLFIPGYESPIQIPWGFGFGSIGAASAQLSMFLFGKSTAKEFAGNMKTIASETAGLPISQMSFLENPFAFIVDSIIPAPAKPLFQMVADVDSLGRPVFNKGQSKYVSGYMGGENIPESVKYMGEVMFDTFNEVLPKKFMDALSPNGLNFIGNSYLGGVYRTMGLMDSSLRATGIFTENEQKDINVVKATLLLSGFVGTAANYDARRYYEMKDDIENYRKTLRTYKDLDPEKYAEYRDEHPGRVRAVEYFDRQQNSALRDLQEKANKIKQRYRDEPKEREEALKENRERQNALMQRMVDRTREMLEE